MTDDRRLDDHSRKLLRAVDDVRALERRKRAAGRSTPEFHELASAVERQSHEVFKLAVEEQAMGAEDSPIEHEREDDSPGDWWRRRDS